MVYSRWKSSDFHLFYFKIVSHAIAITNAIKLIQKHDNGDACGTRDASRYVRWAMDASKPVWEHYFPWLSCQRCTH